MVSNAGKQLTDHGNKGHSRERRAPFHTTKRVLDAIDGAGSRAEEEHFDIEHNERDDG